MRIVRLANLLELKYNFTSQAGLADIMGQVKSDLISAYNLYVNSQTAKEPVLAMVAQMGEPFTVSFVHNMNKMIANLDVLAESPALLFNSINKMLGAIQEVKDDKDKTVRNFIHDSIRVTKQSEKNYRELVKSKFETMLYRLSHILEKQAKTLKVFLPKEVELAGGGVLPERKELSKDKLRMFLMTPAAQKYGLHSLDILEKVLSDPELKEKLTTLINAVDRGHVPADGPEIAEATQEIMDWFKSKQTNAKQFEDVE